MKIANPQEIERNQLNWTINPGNLEMEIKAGEKKQMAVVFTEGGRFKEEIKLVGEGAELELLMVFVGAGKTILNMIAQIGHLAANTKAKVALKAILFDQSQLEFRGNLVVPQNAHGTDTYLRCESLLMSHQAIAKTIPALEIVANDVKAGHAATVGRVDEENLFYLESRGLSRKQAQTMLLEAFLAETKNFFSDMEIAERENFAEKVIKLLPTNFLNE